MSDKKGWQSKYLVTEIVGWRRALAATPVQNRAVEMLSGEGEPLLIGVRLERPRWLIPPLTWFMQPRQLRRMALDPLGAQVWRWCDGSRTVEGVVDLFAREYGYSFHEARIAVTEYIKALVQRGILAIGE